LGVGAFERAGDLEQEMLIGNGADELKADRKAFRGEAAGDGDGGNAGEVGGAIHALVPQGNARCAPMLGKRPVFT
jgi:hypothetical protein